MKAKPFNVLLVEDEEAHVELIERAFEDQDPDVTLSVAHSLREASDYLATAHPALVIVDWLLPDGKGIELLPKNKDETPYPIVVMTSHGDEQVAVEAMKAGALDYIVKSEAAFAAMPRIVKRVLREWGHIVKRRRAERALRASEANLAQAQQIAHLGSWRWDIRTDEIFWSDEMYRICGYTPGEFEPNRESVAQVLHPHDRERANKMAQQAIEAGQPYQLEKRVIRPDGSERVVFAQADIVYDRNDQATEMVGTFLDITDLRRTEEALRFSEERYRNLFDSAVDAIFIFDDEGCIVDANPASGSLLGHRREELLELNISDFLDRIGRDRHPERWQRFIESGQAWGESTVRHTDGTTVETEYRATANFMPGLHLAVLRDVTERKQAEAEIERRNNELALLNRVITASAAAGEPEIILEIVCRELARAFDVPNAAAALLNNDRSVATIVAEYSSEARASSLGLEIPITADASFRQLMNLRGPLAVTDALNDPRLAAVRPIMRARGTVSVLMIPFVVEAEVVGGLGLTTPEPRQFSAEELQLAKSIAGQVSGALVRARLEQEQKQLQAEYQQAQKMEAIGQLAAGIAHDFNNLLTAINGFAELMQYNMRADDRNREMVQKIRYSGQRAADLVSQLLAFSRKQIVRPKVISLNKHVATMEKMLRRIIGETIELKTRLAPDLWPVKVDPAQIEQVILNLAVNARDAMPEGGQLTLETSNVTLDRRDLISQPEIRAGDYVLLAVTDTGPGIDEEIRAHIFEPFFTTKEVGKGTGLGLASVFGIVKQSGGDIRVESQPRAGTTFRIYLPRTGETSLPEFASNHESKLPVGQETILLVEDDAQVRDLLRNILEEQAYTLIEAKDGQEALQLAAHHIGPIHMLVTDVVMPGMSGKVLAHQLTQLRPELKTLFISGYNDEVILKQGVFEPGTELLQKPFSPTLLAHKIRSVLDS